MYIVHAHVLLTQLYLTIGSCINLQDIKWYLIGFDYKVPIKVYLFSLPITIT